SGFCSGVNDRRLLVRFPCITVSSAVRRTPSSKRVEPPRRTLYLSQRPVPKKVILRPPRRPLAPVMRVFLCRWACHCALDAPANLGVTRHLVRAPLVEKVFRKRSNSSTVVLPKSFLPLLFGKCRARFLRDASQKPRSW